MARAAVEMGAWGLAAEQERVSLSRLLGGTRTAIATAISIGIQASPQALAEKAGDALAHGYRKTKMKIRLGADAAFVAAVRAVLGPGDAADSRRQLRVHVGARRPPRGAGRVPAAVDRTALAQEDLRRHAHLQDRLDTPICLDESITHAVAVEDMLALGAGRIVNVKPGRVGGFARAKAIHDLCRNHAVPVWCGGMQEGGAGRSHDAPDAYHAEHNQTGTQRPLPPPRSPNDENWRGGEFLHRTVVYFPVQGPGFWQIGAPADEPSRPFHVPVRSLRSAVRTARRRASSTAPSRGPLGLRPLTQKVAAGSTTANTPAIGGAA